MQYTHPVVLTWAFVTIFYRNTCRKRPFNKFKYPRGTDVTQNVGIKRASFPGNVIPWSYTTIPNNLWENLSAYDHAWTGYKYEYIVSYSRISFLTVISRFLQSYIVSYSRISFLTVIYRFLQSYIVSYSHILLWVEFVRFCVENE